ncbi:hypothetical protein O6H91_Y376800 [Diphasiastrum complanatum]|nr:hypothetical protein O6H91_Y376800 [Diphasiastrum complanatum]
MKRGTGENVLVACLALAVLMAFANVVDARASTDLKASSDAVQVSADDRKQTKAETISVPHVDVDKASTQVAGMQGAKYRDRDHDGGHRDGGRCSSRHCKSKDTTTADAMQDAKYRDQDGGHRDGGRCSGRHCRSMDATTADAKASSQAAGMEGVKYRDHDGGYHDRDRDGGYHDRDHDGGYRDHDGGYGDGGGCYGRHCRSRDTTSADANYEKASSQVVGMQGAKYRDRDHDGGYHDHDHDGGHRCYGSHCKAKDISTADVMEDVKYDDHDHDGGRDGGRGGRDGGRGGRCYGYHCRSVKP